ncbi:MAG: S8 family serine peptidase, partial [Caulobacterales bacterium]|nr:S8 family serine peptidase [Caulobacterales bacterium]
LAGNIHALSTDIVDGRDELSGPDSHGTLVAGVVAAVKNDSGVHGLAFDSQVLAIRADTGPDDDPNDACGSPQTSCGFADADLAAAVDYAVANGADIINLSLGGEAAPPLLLGSLRAAVDAGVLIVVAAGNDGSDGPLHPALFASDLFAEDLAVSVGSVDEDGVISDFTNHATGAIEHYLLAPGEDVISTAPGGSTEIVSGTSFAAPYVSASLALLLDAFPALTPREALQILYDTADDYNTPGPDTEAGWGLVNLARAFQPVGSTTASFGGQAIDTSAVLAAPGGAFGDFAYSSGLFDGLLIRDAYDRGFAISPDAAPLPDAALGAFEAAALANRLEARAARTPFGHAAFRPGEDEYIAFTNLETDDQGELSVSIEAGRLKLSAGRGFAPPAPSGRVGGAILSANALSGGVAPLAATDQWTAADIDFGLWSFGMRASGGEDSGLQAAHVARRFGAHEMWLEAGAADERERAFGSTVMGRFGGVDEGRSSFAALAWEGPLAGKWRGGARVEGARADLAAPDSVSVSADPVATAWSIAAERAFKHAALGFTLSQPLRVESGSVSLATPVGVDEDNRTIFETRTASLAPSGREIGLETALRAGLAKGVEGAASLRVAASPGHFADAEPETAACWDCA